MKYLDLLGYSVTDCVTQFQGVVESVSYDLYGCIQCIVRAPVNEKGELGDGRWFDAKRLNKSSGSPVMPVPAFENEAGAAEKPRR